jgi:hypothetical protein
MSEWLPIESTPKDGTFVDLWFWDPDERIPNCSWRTENVPFESRKATGWFRQHDEFGWDQVWLPEDPHPGPSHWMTPPKPPEANK